MGDILYWGCCTTVSAVALEFRLRGFTMVFIFCVEFLGVVPFNMWPISSWEENNCCYKLSKCTKWHLHCRYIQWNYSEDISRNCKTKLQFFTVTWTSILPYIVQCRSVDSSLQLKTVNLITVIPLNCTFIIYVPYLQCISLKMVEVYIFYAHCYFTILNHRKNGPV